MKEKNEIPVVDESKELQQDESEIINDVNDENVTDTSDNDDTDNCEKANEEFLELENKIAELQDKYIRTVAEFDNYRKRTLKVQSELILNGGEKVITALLPVLDDMDRALKNGETTDDPQVLRDGMNLICQKMRKILESQGLHEIETDNEDFNTELHEAVALVPGMGDEKKGKVIDCVTKGYKLNDKVIRYAKVAVGQ